MYFQSSGDICLKREGNLCITYLVNGETLDEKIMAGMTELQQEYAS
jgi:hypothetical protein